MICLKFLFPTILFLIALTESLGLRGKKTTTLHQMIGLSLMHLNVVNCV